MFIYLCLPVFFIARANELAQFAAVLSHRAFQASPLATLQEHIANSMAVQQAEQHRLKQMYMTEEEKNKQQKKKNNKDNVQMA